MTIPGLSTRKPTGRVPWPCILLEGEPKAGKSWAAAQLSASEKVGQTYWLDLDEGAADEYGVLPGARYEVIDHDGSYAQILAAVRAVHAEARRAADAGEPPVVLVVDSLSAVWDMLKDWTAGRAKKSRTNQAKLREDPNAELTISQNLWNDAGARWAAFTTPLLTFPGIVVAIARGKEVVAMDDNGRPIEGRKEWRVEVRKNWEFGPSVWVRMQRETGATVIGARSVTAGLVPGKDQAKPVTDRKAEGRLLEWLVFDAMGVDPATATARDLRSVHAGELLEHEKAAAEPAQGRPHLATSGGQRVDPPAPPVDWSAKIRGAADVDQLRAVWTQANRAGALEADVDTPGGSFTVAELITAWREHLTPPTPALTELAAAEQVAIEGLGATPVEGEVLPAAGAPSVGIAVADPEDLCRDTPQRRAVLTELAALFGGNEARDAAIAQQFNLEPVQVATKRLREFMTREQKPARQEAVS